MNTPAEPVRLHSGKALIFLANVRTASNSIIAAFQEALGESAVFHLRAGFADGPGSYGDFLKAAGRDAHAVYAGHFVFGAHCHLGSPAEYVTTVRDPVDRVLLQVAAIRAATAADLDVPAWLDSYPEANNGMVKRLCGYGLMPGAGHVYDGLHDRLLDGDVEVGEPHLEQAIAHIDRYFRFVLLFGRQAENLLLLERAYGTGPLFFFGIIYLTTPELFVYIISVDGDNDEQSFCPVLSRSRRGPRPS